MHGRDDSNDAALDHNCVTAKIYTVIVADSDADRTDCLATGESLNDAILVLQPARV